MQSLWSRAGQAQRCGCRSCSTAVGALGRRTTAAPRRKITFAEVFTACYSSVFASAVLIDSIRKEERRQNIDHQIDEARRDLALLKERGMLESADVPSPERQLELLDDNQMDGVWQSLKSISITRPFITDVRDFAQLRPGESTKKLRRNRYFRRRKRHMGISNDAKLELLERAIMTEEVDVSVPRRDALTPEHLHKQSDCIKSLVRRLMHTAQKRTQLRPGWQTGPIFGETSRLLKQKWPNYTLRGFDPATAREQTCKLNKSLRSILHSRHLSREEKIGRVCYNLLAATYLPDMHTYNTLIVGFDKIGLYCCSEHIINSFFHDRTLKPTRCTHTAVLHHYKATNNHFQFLRTLECLCGVNPTTGALVRRKHIRAIEGDHNLLRWSLNAKTCTRVGNYVYEHAPLSKMLVNEIVQGLMHFKLFNEAVHVFVMCLQRKVSLATSTIMSVLDDCLDYLDWDASVRLLRALSRHGGKRLARLLNSQDGQTVAYYVDRLYSLLDITGINSAGETLNEDGLANMGISAAEIAEVLRLLAQTVASLPGHMSESQDPESEWENVETQALQSRILQLESLSREAMKVRKVTKTIECGILRTSVPLEEKASLASDIGSSAINESMVLQDEFTQLTLSSALRTEDTVAETDVHLEHQVTRPQSARAILKKGPDGDRVAQGPRSATSNDISFFYPLPWLRSRDERTLEQHT